MRGVFRWYGGTNAIHDPLSTAFPKREPSMNVAKIIMASTVTVVFSCSAALAQQAMTGSITKVDEANGKIAIQQTQTGTVGASSAGTAEDFKMQDGLMFNALQPGDKVVFTATEIGGAKTITKIEKQ